MKPIPRHERIISLIEEKGFLSLGELSQDCGVSEMTIRRDLVQLASQDRLRRIKGGAISLHQGSETYIEEDENSDLQRLTSERMAFDQVDILIATSVDPNYDSLLIDMATKNNVPIIAESIEMPGQSTLVAIDNLQAGLDLGYQVGQILTELGYERANLLDISYHQSNTRDRSRGFVDGLSQTCPSCEVVLSVDGQSRYETSYQMACDALKVYPNINVIVAINEISAMGAINACRDLKINPERIMVVPFGLEGDAIKNELTAGVYCKIALASFPEIASKMCIQAAIATYNQLSLPEKLVVPHIILTTNTMQNYYTRSASGWKSNWAAIQSELKYIFPIELEKYTPKPKMPHQIGFIVPFIEHGWYKQLVFLMKLEASRFNIGFQVIDAELTVRQELEIRRRQIATKAAELIETGDVVLIDSGPISRYLAEDIRSKNDITVITNSVPVIDVLKNTPGIILISTGGTIIANSEVMVGPIAVNTIHGIRADKLYLMVSGITLDFGLSHNVISEAVIKQAMTEASRQIILLADHTSFIANSGIGVAPLSQVDKIITDSGLSPNLRLNISKTGIQFIVV
jgi:DeoR/GlpR family transcriptional regulator of sugar metabolism/ABC-type sugar transport system substrate-binding protein